MARSKRQQGARRGSTNLARPPQWHDSLLNSTVSGNSLATVDLLGNLPVQQRKGTTIVRTILSLSLAPNTANLASVLDYGLVVAENTSVLAGLLAQPDIQDDQPGWLFRDRQITRVADINEQMQAGRVERDVKSMRKFKGNEFSYLFVINNTGIVAVELTGIIRTLIKRA